MLDMNASLMYSAIARRKSRRSFDGKALSDEQLDLLRNLEAEELGVARLHTHFMHRPGGLDHVFRGVVGSYGKTTGASALLAFTAPSSVSWAAGMECGYVGQQFVLMAEHLGLGSCWNGGMFGVKQLMGLVPLGPDERVVSLIALGTPLSGADELGRLAKLVFKRKSIQQIASEALLKSAEYIPHAVEAVRLAPSAINRQPWLMDLAGDDRVLLRAAKEGGLVPVDLGIAMLHFRVAAMAQGIQGTWAVESANRALFSRT